MKVVLVTLFLVFLSTSSALGVSRRFGKQVSVHSLHLEKISSLGSALKGLIQLADADELGPVVEIIEEITEEFQGILNANNQQLAVLTQQHETDEAAAQQTIDNIEQSLSDAEDDLASSQAQAQDLQNSIDSNTQAINEAIDSTNAEQQRRASTHAAYQQHVADAQEALGDLQAAASILQEISGDDLSAAFIQMQKKKLFKSLSLIQKKLTKINLRTSPTSVYIGQLIQVAQDAEAQGSINADLFNQIFVLIQSFEDSIQQEIDSTNQADQDDEQQSENTLATLAGIISAQQDALQDNQSKLSAVNGHISDVESQIAGLEQNLSDAKANLDNIEATYAQQSQILQGYINRLSVDIDVLQRALVFVQTENAQIGDAADGVSARSFQAQAAAGSDNGDAASDDEAAQGGEEASDAQEAAPEVPQLDVSWVTAPQEEAQDVPSVPEPPAPEAPAWQTGPAEEHESSDEEPANESDKEESDKESDEEESDKAAAEESDKESDEEESDKAAAEESEKESDEEESDKAAAEESDSEKVDFL